MDNINLGSSRIETHCMMVVCDSGNQSGRVMLRWRKAGLDLAARSSIPWSLFINTQRKKKKT